MPILSRNYDPAIKSVRGKDLISDLDTTSASSGQVPTYNGTTVVWGSPSGFVLPAVETDSTTTTGTSLSFLDTTLTTGTGVKVTGTTGVFTTGGALFKGDMSAATAGNTFVGVTTGVYTGTGLLLLTANSATTGTLASVSGTGLTTGKGLLVTATAATLTTGRYVSLNDGALEVFGVGADGHIHTSQTTAPTVSGASHGLTPAITAGSSDVAGTITTTGTNDAGGDSVITVTFNKTYTVAPKSVSITPLNSSASKAAATSLFTAYVSSKSATTFVVTVPSDASAGATPSWSYQVIA